MNLKFIQPEEITNIFKHSAQNWKIEMNNERITKWSVNFLQLICYVSLLLSLRSQKLIEVKICHETCDLRK